MYYRRTFLSVAAVFTAGCVDSIGGESKKPEPALMYSPFQEAPADAESVPPDSIENERIRSVAIQACEEQERGARNMGTRGAEQLEMDFKSLPTYSDPDDEFAPAVVIDCEDGQMILELVYLT